MRLLCLSNGHGEDAIAVRILKELQKYPNLPELAALPIVGEGHAYSQLDVPLIGSVKTMPSGGFIYMDSRQLARDIQGGLLKLTSAQLNVVRDWAKQGGFILAVGDIVPLAYAWLSKAPFAFVGTAKSEYYLRDEAGWLTRPSWWDDRLERWTGCIYLPWERWLMSNPRCTAVFPRDHITAVVLQQQNIPAFDLGNPMMDGLEVPGIVTPQPLLQTSDRPLLTIALLPGSRPPEAYNNWDIILQAINGLVAKINRPLRLLAAIAPGLDMQLLEQKVKGHRWQQVEPEIYSLGVGERHATLTLSQQNFAEALNQSDMAIAMAGTATEQFVGLGKPAITIVGEGPQFTLAFAEAQTRLLGASISLVRDPFQVAEAIQSLLENPDRLHLIAENGPHRMGPPGAAKRIAACIIEKMAATSGSTS